MGVFSNNSMKKSEKMRRAHYEKWLKEGHLKIENIDGFIRDKVRACRADFPRELCHVSNTCEECDIDGSIKRDGTSQREEN